MSFDSHYQHKVAAHSQSGRRHTQALSVSLTLSDPSLSPLSLLSLSYLSSPFPFPLLSPPLLPPSPRRPGTGSSRLNLAAIWMAFCILSDRLAKQRYTAVLGEKYIIINIYYELYYNQTNLRQLTAYSHSGNWTELNGSDANFIFQHCKWEITLERERYIHIELFQWSEFIKVVHNFSNVVTVTIQQI